MTSGERLASRGLDVHLRVPLFSLLYRFRCRITSVINTPALTAFTYVTLAGHPEQGFETFIVRPAPSGGTEISIRTISRPVARVFPRLAQAAQGSAIGRYGGALR